MAAILFAPCFDRKKVAKIAPLMDATVLTLHRFYDTKSKPPISIVRCMTHGEIREGKRDGKGHGLHYEGEKVIAINPHMPPLGIYLNFIHEYAHYLDERWTDNEINGVIVPFIYWEVTGEKLAPARWRKWRGRNPDR